MNNSLRSPSLLSKLALMCIATLSVGSLQSHAAVVTGTIVTSTANNGPIDPDGSQTVNTSLGNIAGNTLEARGDFKGAIQNLGVGFDAAPTSLQNIVSFSDPSLPDVRLTLSTNGTLTSTSGANINNSARVTSGTEGYGFATTGNSTVTIRIDFGEWDGSLFNLTSVVDAAGFTIGNARSGTTYTVTYRNLAGVTLGSVLSGSGNDSDTADVGATGAAVGPDLFFGYDSAGTGTVATGSNYISSITIVRTSSGNGNVVSSLDDLGFTTAVVPEPSPGTMLLGGLGLLLGLQRCRNHKLL